MEVKMLQIKIGLTDTTGKVAPEVMTSAAAALNIQVTRDLPQFWDVHATVAYLPDHRKIPQGVWPVQIVDKLPPEEGGFHFTKNNQPYAKIIGTPGSNEWTIDASHETLEMLVDPSGNRLQTSTAIAISGTKIVEGVGQFEYLVEACDPCEADVFSYQISGIAVSDFITPHFYEPNALPGTRYSFTGALKAPRQILDGGYISWTDPKTDRIQQLLNFNNKPFIKDLGPASGAANLRTFVDSRTRLLVPQPKSLDKEFRSKKKDDAAYTKALEAATAARSKHYV
jgi:hypothetical protein